MIRKWNERRAEKARKAQEQHDARVRQRMKTIAEAKEQMLLRDCPFVTGCCKDTCIHFEEGYIKNNHKVHDCGVDTWQTTVLPKCKLWKGD